MYFNGIIFAVYITTLLGQTNSPKPNFQYNTIFNITDFEKLEKVLNGLSEITSQGTNYRITLSATDGSTSKKYAANVLDNPTQHVRKLTNFTPIKA
ncbi:hypothetical protein RYX36_001471 [Vicia faba]